MTTTTRSSASTPRAGSTGVVGAVLAFGLAVGLVLVRRAGSGPDPVPRSAPSPGPPPSPEPRPARTGNPVRVVGTALAAVLIVIGLVLVGCAATGQGPVAPPVATAQGPIEAVPSPAAGTAGATARALLPSPPTSIRIPSIDVASRVDSVGLQPDGSLEVPAPGPLYDEAAWFRSSVTPGQVGPSVIVGHIDSAKNGPSVFYDLANLRPGAALTVTRADGTTLAFRVDGLRSYPKDAFPTETVYGGTTRPELRLITCGGDFDRSVRSYRDNTVVFAHLLP